MLNNATGFTDLWRGIEGLASIVKFKFNLDPYDKDTLFLFCGRRSVRIKALLWVGDGFMLMYKRLNIGAFEWPGSNDEAIEIDEYQYRQFMRGFSIVARRPIIEIEDPPRLM